MPLGISGVPMESIETRVQMPLEASTASTKPKELGAHPKEKGMRPKEEGAAAQMPDGIQKPPRRMLTPDYTLLDCSTEDMEDYLRSSSRGPEDYLLGLHLHNPENHSCGIPSPCLHLHMRGAEWKKFRIDMLKEKWKWIEGNRANI
ncbi:hypothetical protein BTVI_41623 [Pitangus sulphuratus]|nr:hypothetical protein BTVI_41623 [Pitangus sulphuratus]